jgi:uncharacterized Fe-S cluster protein YjdI
MKEYVKDDLVVIWKPDLCIHCGNCAKSLPQVFKPREKPWIQLEGSDVNTIRSVVAACPSGALSYRQIIE